MMRECKHTVLRLTCEYCRHIAQRPPRCYCGHSCRNHARTGLFPCRSDKCGCLGYRPENEADRRRKAEEKKAKAEAKRKART